MTDQPHIPTEADLAAERQETRKLVELGLEMVARGASGIPEEAIHEWLLSDEELPFPEPVSQ